MTHCLRLRGGDLWYGPATILRLSIVLFSLGGLVRLGAADAIQVATTNPPHRYSAPAREDITLDGDLREWSWDKSIVPITTETFGLNPPPVRSKEDCSAKVQFAWDGGGTLYLAAIIEDQNIVPLGKPDAMPWTCDSLMLSLTTFGATKASARYQQVKNVKTANEPFFGFSFYVEKTGPRQWTKNTRYLARSTQTGYVIEAAVALADIGYAPRSGDKVKASFILVDHDADGKFAQLVHRTKGHGGAAFGHWYDVRFRGLEPYAGEMVPAQKRLGPSAGVGVIGEVDAFRGGLKLAALRLKDSAGEVVATLTADADLPSGRRTIFSAEFGELSLKPGHYRVDAVIADGGRESNGDLNAGFEIVSSTEAETGAMGKLPDRYIVPDPTRFAFPSDRRKYKPQKVTREDYLRLTRRVYDHEAYLYTKGREASAGIHGVYYAVPAYMLFRQTGEAHFLEEALGLVRHAHEAHVKSKPTPHWDLMHKVVEMLINDPKVKEEDRKWLREFTPRLIKRVWELMRPQEWGAFNRALLWGHSLDIAARRMPDAPQAKEWKAYADLEWDSWWPYRDHDENSSDYNGASMMGYLDWAAFRNPEFLKDPGFASWVERYVYQVTPCGGMPGYGDASPWNASAYFWIPIFERMATITRDGRFKWAAHRLFEYAEKQMDDLFSYHMVYDGAASACAWAWFYADDSVAEAAPQMKSRITHRKRVVPVNDAFKKEMLDKHNITGLYYRLEEGLQPDKLILRAGGDPFAPAGMIELCSDAGHHMSTVPNLNNLMHQRAVLLTDLGYFEKGPEYHNVVFIEDLTGIAPEAADEKVTVPVFEVGAQATYASVNVDNYKGWPVTNERRVLFTHEGLVVVKDLVHFHRPFVTRVRQQWQTRNISPKAGEHWANTNIPYLLMTGLGLGRGVQRWLNPAWDLLIYFTPQPGRDYEVHDRSLENIWQAVPLRLSQRYRGLPKKGEPIHFTTLLWPHRPVMEVEDYVRRIKVIEDGPQVTAFRVDVTDKRTLFLGINDTGQRREFGPASTDASVFVLIAGKEEGKLKPVHLFARAATSFVIDGQALHESGERSSVDRNY